MLASDVVRLSNLLTKERKTLPSAYLKDEGLRRAYKHYFLPSNLYKIHIPLKELSIHPKKPLTKDRLRVLDIGSGPGTAILGVLDYFSVLKHRPFLEFTAVEPVAENLREAKALFKASIEESRISASLETINSGLESISEGRVGSLKGTYDIIILSNLLNEVANLEEDRLSRRVSILKRLMTESLSDDGSCIIIEPALRETSREMLEVRDGLLEEGFNIYSPCLMGDKCPALENPKDWCHEDVPWEAPAIVKEVDRLTGLRKETLKFSYLIIRKDGLSITEIFDKNSFRVVSEPLRTKGKIEFYICGASGRRLIVRFDKDKAPANETFSGLRRGDIVSIVNPVDEGKRLRVAKDAAVSITIRTGQNA